MRSIEVVRRKVVPRSGLGFLMAAALLAIAACDYSSAEVGAVGVCSTERGELLTHGVSVIFLSDDGGFTWEWEGGIEHCVGSSEAQNAETPRGAYTIEGADIVRDFEGKRETSYSAIVFNERADRIVIEAATVHWEERKTVIEPQAIHYDDRSGNVIVAMGLQGVVVGTPDGNWARVAVGPYYPVDFSVYGRLRRLNQTVLWSMAFALSASLTVLAAILSLSNADAASRRGCLRATLDALAVCSFALALLATATFSVSSGDFQEDFDSVVKILCGLAITGSIISAAGARPLWVHWRVVAVTFVGMLLLFEMSFFMWMSGVFKLYMAKIVAIVLMTIVAFALNKYLLRTPSDDYKREHSTEQAR